MERFSLKFELVMFARWCAMLGKQNEQLFSFPFFVELVCVQISIICHIGAANISYITAKSRIRTL